ncbi:putative sucrose-phosphatase 2 [Porphyridium purpureum]|uniref:Putative sucrose-phosphatase 2 n=1 Tax=Porphyridium purpureum TaxID=35688 RepID=A0A5J4Z709_PORPP|nr:putative sucrose-phosphatase 2 [Porphyridium purpureum]|eukprot:POR4240..scf295_1
MRKVRLIYRSGWTAPRMHYVVHGNPENPGTWTKPPGRPMSVCNGFAHTSGSWFDIEIEIDDADQVRCLEFAPNDGHNAWDNPSGSPGANYTVEVDRRVNTIVLFSGRVSTTRSSAAECVMVVTDLDGTLLGDDTAMFEFFDTWQRSHMVAGSVLVYNTGRSLDLFQQVKAEKKLLTPAALISSVGTEVYWFGQDGSWRKDAEWDATLQGHGWDVDAARGAASDLMAQEKYQHGAHWRPVGEQNAFKLVVGVRASLSDAFVQDFTNALQTRRTGTKAKLILSGHGDWKYLDILSPAAGKLAAMMHVRECVNREPNHKRDVLFDATNTLCCGDSGNDIGMMEGDEHCIIVGNSQRELLDWYAAQTRHERLFRAERHCAGGILQGLQAWRARQGESTPVKNKAS